MVKTQLLGAIAIAAGLMTSGIDTAAAPKLTLRVTPAVSAAPSNLTVSAYVEKDSENRTLEIAADSGMFYRSSEIQLEGDQAPMLTQVRLKNLPSGNYEIVVVLRNARGEKTVARANAMVLSPGNEP